MKQKIVFYLSVFFITGFCSLISPVLGVAFWKGLVISVLSGLFTMAMVTFIDFLAKLISNGKNNSETV